MGALSPFLNVVPTHGELEVGHGVQALTVQSVRPREGWGWPGRWWGWERSPLKPPK